MSAYAYQMERQFSSQSLSSRDQGSEMESHYESGFYMTSFAATIFIGALVTVGVLLIALLIALMVMLQSCQSKNSGVVDFSKSFEDYSNCKIFAQHAELNNLEAHNFPPVCKDLAIRYIKGGQYARDLNFTIRVAENYFDSATPLDDGQDVVLMDIDDIFLSNPPSTSLYRLGQFGCNDFLKEAKHLKDMLMLRLYIKLRACGWSMILLSRKPDKQWNATVEHLISIGYGGWFSLIMRSDDEMQMDSREYFFRRRAELQKQGFRIIGLISTQMDAITGPYLGRHIFKLPNPIYYNFEHHKDSTNLPE